MTPAPARIVVDVRPLQEPEHAPVTAAYLGRLLRAFAADPLPGESFVVLQRADLPEPDPHLVGLTIAARRILPATRFLRAATQTVDPFLVRALSVGAGWGAAGSGAVGSAYLAAGTILPIASRLPVVAALLDLAPWQLPGTFQRTPAARFGARLRLRLLRQARFVMVGTDAVARIAERGLRIAPDRLRVVPLAARDEYRSTAADDAAAASERDRLGLPARYLVWSARHDARHDLPTLLAALRSLGSAPRPAALPPGEPWPPRVLVVEAAPADRAALARAASRAGLGEAFAYAPLLPAARLATLVRAARVAIAPAVSDAAGLAVVEALAAGVPVVASGVGGLPELVGRAGILVPPRSPDRLAAAIAAMVGDDRLHGALAAEARQAGAVARSRSWRDVARDVRRVLAEAVS